jgi:hypothetical protein
MLASSLAESIDSLLIIPVKNLLKSFSLRNCQTWEIGALMTADSMAELELGILLVIIADETGFRYQRVRVGQRQFRGYRD